MDPVSRLPRRFSFVSMGTSPSSAGSVPDSPIPFRSTPVTRIGVPLSLMPCHWSMAVPSNQFSLAPPSSRLSRAALNASQSATRPVFEALATAPLVSHPNAPWMTVMVTATVALPAFPSVATTVTGCVAPAVRVTPARVTIWPELDPMSKEAAPVPSRLYVSVSSSASVAVTLPITVPADALSRTVNERAPAENTGGLLAVAVIVTAIVVLSFMSLATTVTLYVVPAVSVTPAFVWI